MWSSISLERCLSFIHCQLLPVGSHAKPAVRPAITISRMTGAGGRSVAEKLAEHLQATVPCDCPWTVFDRTLMEKVLADHHVSQRVAQYEPENHKPFIQDTLEEVLGLHPSTWTIVHQTAETIWQLASMGCVILVGRGAAAVTANMAHAFHVRLVGGLEPRVRRIQEVYQLELQAALEFAKREDKGRRRYLKEHYHREIDDPLIYDLVINTDRTSYEEAARIIGDTVIRRFHLLQPAAGATP